MRVLHPSTDFGPNNLLNRLLGNPKEKESLTGLLLNTRVIQLKLGRIDVRFQKPFSLKGYIEEQTARRTETRLKTPGLEPNPKKEQDVLLRALGYQVGRLGGS